MDLYHIYHQLCVNGLYLIFELKRIGNNINQIARSINYSNLITEVELDELRKGIEELIVEVEKDFLIRSEKLRKFYGHH